MIIAIEGHDGVGKTTLAKSLAKNLGYEYVKQAITKLIGLSEREYLSLSEKIIGYNNDILTAMFLSVNDMFALDFYKNKNVILDRHCLLNYHYNGNKNTEDIFYYSIKHFGKPDLTILLNASPKTRIERIKKRNVNDSDLKNQQIINADILKMKQYLINNAYNFVEINTDGLSTKQVVKLALKEIEFQNFTKV